MAESANNIEAGIVVTAHDGDQLPVPHADSYSLSLETVVAAESVDTEEELPYDRGTPRVSVTFDWNARTYTIQASPAADRSLEGWTISLPGINGKVSLTTIDAKTLYLGADKVTALIMSRLCTISRQEESTAMRAYVYVNEVNIPEGRQPMRYSDLNELLNHLQTHGGRSSIGSSGGGELNLPVSDRMLADEEALSQEPKPIYTDVVSSYFTMFRAFHAKRKDIEGSLDPPCQDRLKRAVELGAGNLWEMWSHIETALDASEMASSPVYSFFLLREFLEVLQSAERTVRQLVTSAEEPWVSELTFLMKKVSSKDGCL